MSFLIFFSSCIAIRVFLDAFFFFFSAFEDYALYRNTSESQKRPKTADTIRSNESSKEEFFVFPNERSPSSNQKSKHTRDQKDAASVKARTWRQKSSDEDGKYEGRSFSFLSSHPTMAAAARCQRSSIFNEQNKNLTCAANLFLYIISLPLLHDCDVKMPIFAFY